MTFPSLQPEVIEALRSAGATEEMIAAAVKASGEFATPHPSRGGRPRKHADDASRYRAYRGRRKKRHETGSVARHETHESHETRHETRDDYNLKYNQRHETSSVTAELDRVLDEHGMRHTLFGPMERSWEDDASPASPEQLPRCSVASASPDLIGIE
jgi:hypothetical protein